MSKNVVEILMNNLINSMNEEKVDLRAPWLLYCRKVECLFSNDSEISVLYNRKEPKIVLYVNTIDKAKALSKILPKEKTFGNVTLKIVVVGPDLDKESTADLIRKAFKGNDILESVFSATDSNGTDRTYASFKACACQYQADDISDPYGNETMLAADIAKDVFGDTLGDISVCTESVQGRIKFSLKNFKEPSDICTYYENVCGCCSDGKGV